MNNTAEALDNVVASDNLRDFVTRVERLTDEKQAIAEDIKEIYKQVKSSGLDVATVRQIVKLRSMDAGDVAAQEMLLEMYKSALGMG